MLEPYVLKGTRTVPRRGEMSNHLFLFDKTPNKQVAQKNKSRNPRLLQSRGSSIILSVAVSTVCAEQYKPAHGPDTRICEIQEHHLTYEEIVKKESSIPAASSEEIPVNVSD